MLCPFGSDEIDALFDGYTRDTPTTFTASEKKLAVDLGGGFPFFFFLQMAGCLIVEAKQAGLRDEALEIQANTTFDQQAAPHFEYLWTRCSESEKITLLAIRALNKQEKSSKTEPTDENLTSLN